MRDVIQSRRRPVRGGRWFAGFSLLLVTGLSPAILAQESPRASVWLRLDALPGEMDLSPRESFEGVPPRFVLLTDGSIFVGGRRDLLRGLLSRDEMQTVAESLDRAVKSLEPEAASPTVTIGEGPANFRFSVLLGSPLQTVVMGVLPAENAPPVSPLADFIVSLARFRHPSLRPFDPPEFALIVRGGTLPGGCRSSAGLPRLSTAMTSEIVVSERVTRGFPTGAEVTHVCDGDKRFRVVFRPIIPGER